MAETNIYKKLQNMRAALRKSQYSSFSELVDVVGKKAKDYKLLPLYSYLDNMATLTIVDMDDITSKVTFQVPTDLVNVKNAKEQLYNMAFDLEIGSSLTLTPQQFVNLTHTMAEKNVSESEILERYKLKSIVDMTQEIYKRCMSALSRVDSKQQ